MDKADQALFPRFSTEFVTTALEDTPVLMIAGPRQCGKTTLVRDLVASEREFISLDDDTVAERGLHSMLGFQVGSSR